MIVEKIEPVPTIYHYDVTPMKCYLPNEVEATSGDVTANELLQFEYEEEDEKEASQIDIS